MKLIKLSVILGMICCLWNCAPATPKNIKPNIVIIFLDDAGYGDFEPFGKPKYKTPHVAQLAKEGCRYDRFYVPQAVCSASRAALMTGLYPGRTKVFGAHPPLRGALKPEFPTMAEVLKKQGYATGFFGKWHLGDVNGQRPHERGFDEAAGLMYSNDMWRHHPTNPKFWSRFKLKYWENGKVIIDNLSAAQQKNLTKWSTEKAVAFIKKNKDKPFLAYVPHSMPHVPLFCSDAFEGKSGQGIYGDVMMELDWSVGQINQTLKDCGVENNTIVVFTSDNGPWVVYGEHGGVTPFREAKGTSFDGGIRSPCIIKYPPAIKAGSQSSRTFSSLDLMPTFAAQAGAKVTTDGKNVWPIVTGEKEAKNPNVYYPFTNGRGFEGVLSGDGRFKLHAPHSYRTLAGADASEKKEYITTEEGLKIRKPTLRYQTGEIGWALFDMEADPYEKHNVIEKYPEVAKRLKALVEEHRKKFDFK